MGRVMKADGTVATAVATCDLGSDQTEVWITCNVRFGPAALAPWEADSGPSLVTPLEADTDSTQQIVEVADIGSGPGWNDGFVAAVAGTPAANLWQIVELHYLQGTPCTSEVYIDGVLTVSSTPSLGAVLVRFVEFGLDFAFGATGAGPDQIAYFDSVKVGTTRNGTDLFQDDFEGGTFAAWSSTTGDVSIISDPFVTDQVEGIVWAPDDDALTVNPTWVNLDIEPYRLATSYTIVRGRSSETDKTVTGTATITFRDTEGILDPTNNSGPFFGKLDPMKQVALALQNPVTEEWHTIFRGFVAGRDHALDMFTEQRGYDQVTWSCVDAFDLFANVILTHGVHGDPPPLSTFPNIYYKGGDPSTTVGSGFPGVLGTFVHVDQRIAQLLDDAGWPGTGETIDVANLRNIFSGNVQVQGVVYSRKDALLSALFDAADAEFPGIANIFVSKEGVVTFHGRFARFFPDNPGYGINQWYVGSGTAAALDPDIAPLTGPVRFYRSKDDIINACYALPAGVDETDGGVVHASDSVSQGTFGYRSENFDNLLVMAGHTDDGYPTTAVEEANKFADYYVGNYADPKTRCGTLRFVMRDPGMVGAAALADLICRVEIGDVINLYTTHPGGGGFQEQFYVEQIRYQVEPGTVSRPTVVCELEVSPASFFGFNPFGDDDNQFS